MPTIKLAQPWSYRTPLKTIDYAAGEHDVFQYIADQAEKEGVIEKEIADGDAEQPAKAGKKGSARKGES